MFGVVGDFVFETFEEIELNSPSPRKAAVGRTIYACCQLPAPKDHSGVMLYSCGSVMVGDRGLHTADVQPIVYPVSEAILGVPWWYKIDI